MNMETRSCPSSEVLAAFIDGRSSRHDLVAVIEHLQDCSRCRSIIETAAEEEQESALEEAPIPDAARRRTRPRWLVPAAAAATIVVLGGSLWTISRKPSGGLIEQLAAAAPAMSTIDGRVTGGFRWAPRVGTRQEIPPAPDPNLLLFDGAAGEVLKALGGRTDAAALHASGVALLLTKHPAEGADRLERAARLRPADAHIWNDLAAARLQNAENNPGEVPRALAAADRAVSLAPDMAEARFNRALILRRLGLRDQTRDAWNEFLERERSGPWADKARDDLRQLGPRADFRAERKAAFAVFEAGDTRAMDSYLSADPQEARTYCEGYLMAQWALAEREGNAARAASLLKQLQWIARALSARGEYFLHDALTVAVDAARDPARRRALIDGYVEYNTGRQLYGIGKPADAELHLRRAAALFERAKTPLVGAAQSFLANAIFDQTRVAEARAILARLSISVDHARHPGLFAQILWELALCDGYEAAWSSSMKRQREARAIFERLGESRHRAFLDALHGETYDHMARVDEGWRHRIAAIDVLSARGDTARLASVLTSAIRSELQRREYDSLLAIATVVLPMNQAIENYELVAETHIRSAIALRITGRPAEAAKALADARTAAARMNGEKRRLQEIDSDVVEASFVRDADPARAVRLLDHAIAFYREHQHDMWLPRAFLERGRAFRAADNRGSALADFNSGIEEVERQRSTINESDLRSGFFDSVPELFSEAIALQLDAGDVELAYVTVERSRARTLYEALGVPHAAPLLHSSQALRSRLDPQTVVVEYQLLPDGLAFFTIDSDSVRATRRQFDLAALRRMTVDLISSIRNDETDRARRAATEAWRLLIEPIASHLERKTRVVFVPDRFLHSVTFPALLDPRTDQYFVEQHEIVIAPSATLAPAGSEPNQGLTPALVVGNPATGDAAERLPYAEAEADAVAALYGTTALTGDLATRAAFVARAPESRLIHYAGHANSTDGDADGHLLLAGSGADATLTASEIARFPLSGTSLVTLAACGTLRGSADRIEGMPSVARAFLAAGVPFVVGTVWDVPDDRIADVFRALHQHLGRGASPATALRAAQREQLKRGGRARLSWATVALIGAHIDPTVRHGKEHS